MEQWTKNCINGVINCSILDVVVRRLNGKTVGLLEMTHPINNEEQQDDADSQSCIASENKIISSVLERNPSAFGGWVKVMKNSIFH